MTYLFWSLTKTITFCRQLLLIVIKYISSINNDFFKKKNHGLHSYEL